MQIECVVNGVAVEKDVHPGTTLLELLREELRLTGSKEGCAKGECGACTVILDGEPVDACLLLAAQADGGVLTTVEGLATKGALHPVQAAFVAEGGVQCGFCTPGLVVSAAYLVDSCQTCPSKDQIHEALEGNLCRCTGYTKVLAAVEKAAQVKLGVK